VTIPSRPADIDALTAGAKAIGVDLTEGEASSLLGFLARFYSWNRFGGFTRITQQDAIRLHLLDSLSAVPALAGAQSVADLGTGGGMPGIPLALVLRESDFTLVESRGRRCSFLREVVREYGLGNRVHVMQADALELAGRAKRYDAIVSRAFLPPRELLILACRIIHTGGRVIIMGSSNAWVGDPALQVLLAETGLELRSDRSFVLPMGSEVRQISCFVRSRGECFT
jgi:16S rRNA (guanine527-N7)-methyltransferase